MQTLKRFQLLDARKVQEERISKKAQQSILGGYEGPKCTPRTCSQGTAYCCECSDGSGKWSGCYSSLSKAEADGNTNWCTGASTTCAEM